MVVFENETISSIPLSGLPKSKKKRNMAPSATETTTVVAPTPNEKKLKFTGGVAAYKELAPVAINKKTELEGPEAAKVEHIARRHRA